LDVSRIRYGALSAPQGNRCYLPAEGAAIIPGLLSRFALEFEQQVRDPGRTAAPVRVPKIVDWDETSRNFVLDERQQSKRPDWTYEPPHAAPATRARPAAVPHDDAHVWVRLPAGLVALLRARAEHERLSIESLVERTLKEWLQKGSS
jgi:hypothetical protein